MQNFKDSSGKIWTFKIDVGVIRRIKNICGVNFLDIDKSFEILKHIKDDVVFCGDILFCCVYDQLDKHNISKDEFEKSLDGEILNSVSDKIIDDIISFFPMESRTALTQMLEAHSLLLTTKQSAATMAIQKILDYRLKSL